jgi:hypothetical protein
MTTSLVSPFASRFVPISAAASRPLHGSIQAVELGALVIMQELLPIMDVEVVAGQGNLLSQGMTSHWREGFRAETERRPMFLGFLYRDGAGGYVPGSRRW